jgi:hypothetical protein
MAAILTDSSLIQAAAVTAGKAQKAALQCRGALKAGRLKAASCVGLTPSRGCYESFV